MRKWCETIKVTTCAPVSRKAELAGNIRRFGRFQLSIVLPLHRRRFGIEDERTC